MATKAEIVQRLLEEKHITTEEAIVMLKETEYINPNPVIGPGIVYPNPNEDDMVPYGEICSCNPKNGGSGICGCIMGNQLVPRNTEIKIYTQTTTDKIESEGCPHGPVCYCIGDCKKKTGDV